MKDNFKLVDNFITEENVNCHFKYEFTSTKEDSHPTSFIVYDLETHNTDRARPCCFLFYRLSKLAGRYNRDLSQNELENCKYDTFVFDGDSCICTALDFFSKFKGEERKVKNRIVEYNFHLHAHNGSGFDTWIILNNLPWDKNIVDIIKNRKGIISLRIFIGYIQKKETKSSISFSRCGMIHLNYSLKKLGKTFKLQKGLLKTEMNHDEIDENNYKDKKLEWLDYIEYDVLCTVFRYARSRKALEEISGYSMNDCLSLPGLGWKYFNSLRTEGDQVIYTYNDKYMKWFVCHSIKGGQGFAFNQFFKSKNCDDISKIISGELNVRGIIYDIIDAYLNFKNKHLKFYKKEYENQFNDCRDVDENEKQKYIIEKLSQLSIHQLIKQIKIDELLRFRCC